MFCSPYILGTDIALQQKLLAPEFCNLKPDVEFLESFAGVVGSRWPSHEFCSICLLKGKEASRRLLTPLDEFFLVFGSN